MIPTTISTANGGGVRERVVGAIRNAAASTGVDFSYLLGQARIESSLNPNARARTSSATGLFQFIDQTWLGTVKQHGGEHGLGWAADAIRRGHNGRFYVADPRMRQAILDLRKQPEAAAAMAGEFAFFNRDGSARSFSEIRERFASRLDGGAAPTNPARPDLGPVRTASLNAERVRPSAEYARIAYLMLAQLGD